MDSTDQELKGKCGYGYMDTSNETDPDAIEYLHKWNEWYAQFKEGAKGHPFSAMFIEMGE